MEMSYIFCIRKLKSFSYVPVLGNQWNLDDFEEEKDNAEM